jgi:hypothetical protein
MYNYLMTVSRLFLNGCSFLTFRPRQGVDTHCGIEFAKKMKLDIAVNLAGGGRGNKRTSFTTKVWCERNPEIAKDCFFLIGSSSGIRVDYPTNLENLQSKQRSALPVLLEIPDENWCRP